MASNSPVSRPASSDPGLRPLPLAPLQFGAGYPQHYRADKGENHDERPIDPTNPVEMIAIVAPAIHQPRKPRYRDQRNSRYDKLLIQGEAIC